MLQLETAGSKLARWATALVVVGAVHGGALAWAFRTTSDDWESQTGGAFIIELSDVTASPDDDPQAVAIGERRQEQEQIIGSALRVASAAEPQKPDEQPPASETTEPPPEDALVKRSEEPPEEEKPKESSAAQSQESPAIQSQQHVDAAAPQKIENATQKSEISKGQSVGLSTIDRAAIVNWQRDLMVHINKHRIYPDAARQRRQNGHVRLWFSLDREGRLLDVRIAQGSGFELLDEAARSTLQRASPFPAPPDSIPGNKVEYQFRMTFRWTN